jgi:hypothetical protein
MNAPTTLVPFDKGDTLSVSSALFDRIVEATNTAALKNRWFLASDKSDVMKEIANAGESAAKAFARDFAPAEFIYDRVIRYVMPLPSRQWIPTPVEEIQFRVHINGYAYERLVAAICSQTSF